MVIYTTWRDTTDLIISVDRFFKVFLEKNISVSLPDLIILATAKYLMDFYDLPSKHIHIVTCDDNIRKGTKGIYELPYVYDPTKPEDTRDKVFTGWKHQGLGGRAERDGVLGTP